MEQAISLESILETAKAVKVNSSSLTFEMQVATFIEKIKRNIKSDNVEDIDASISGLTRLYEELIKEKGKGE